MASSEGRWTAYADERPPVAGPYEWQVPSRACKGMVVRVLANYRERGAGYSKVLSPEFDHWDGYDVRVPTGTMWRSPAGGTELKDYRIELMCVEGLEFTPCPFCKARPKLKGVERANGGGIIITADAHRFNSWWLECCGWAKTPHFADPRDLEKARLAALTKDTPL